VPVPASVRIGPDTGVFTVPSDTYALLPLPGTVPLGTDRCPWLFEVGVETATQMATGRLHARFLVGGNWARDPRFTLASSTKPIFRWCMLGCCLVQQHVRAVSTV